MSQVISVSPETLQSGNSNLTIDTQSVYSEYPFQEISQGLYNEISKSLYHTEKTEDGSVPGFCICCIQGCCVSHCCIQCMNIN